MYLSLIVLLSFLINLLNTFSNKANLIAREKLLNDTLDDVVQHTQKLKEKALLNVGRNPGRCSTFSMIHKLIYMYTTCTCY